MVRVLQPTVLCGQAPGGIVPAPGGLMSTSPVVSPTEDPRPDSVLPMVGGPEPAVALPAARTIPESASRATGAIAALAASSTSKAAAAAAAATSRHASETPVDSAVKVEADPRVGAAGEEGTQQGPIVKQEEAGSAPKGDAAASPHEGSANAGEGCTICRCSSVMLCLRSLSMWPCRPERTAESDTEQIFCAPRRRG